MTRRTPSMSAAGAALTPRLYRRASSGAPGRTDASVGPSVPGTSYRRILSHWRGPSGEVRGAGCGIFQMRQHEVLDQPNNAEQVDGRLLFDSENAAWHAEIKLTAM